MTKGDKIIYWVITIWLSLGMTATGLLQLTKTEAKGAVAPPGAWGIARMGYPVYLFTLIGVWKILGLIAILVSKFPLVNEWPYADFFYLMSAAIFSHIAVGSHISELHSSLLLLTLTMVSWYFRPASRKFLPVRKSNIK